MLNFVICDDDPNMLNKLSILFEKAFIRNDFNGKIVLKTSNYKDVISFMNSNTVNVLVLDIEFKNSLNVDSLSETLARLFEDISGTTKKFLKIDTKGTFIELDEIQFIEKSGMKLIYHTPRGNFNAYSSFSKIENSLPKNFVRCHKSFIANINNIVNISLSDNSITFKNNDICYIGPKFKNYFMEVIHYDTICK